VRHTGRSAGIALLAISMLTPAVAAAGTVPAHASTPRAPASASRSAATQPAPAAAIRTPRKVPLPAPSPATGAADNPLGVPIETLSDDPAGAIWVDGEVAARTNLPGNLSFAIISRASRRIVTSGSQPMDAGGIKALAATATAYTGKTDFIMVVSGNAGVDNAAMNDFAKFLQQIGVSDTGLTQPMRDALGTQSAPFSVLGIPGGASATAWLNVGLVPADLPPSPPYLLPPKGDITGFLQWNILTGQYDFTDEKFPTFTTDGVKDGSATNIITFNGGEYPADVPAGTSGFHVLIVDSVTLRVLDNQTLPTNGGSTPVATLQDAFASQLAADAHMPGFEQFYASKQPPLLLLQSYGHPVGAAQSWQKAADTIGELGGNRLAFLALTDKDTFSLVGSTGGPSYAVGASTVTGQGGALSGILTRTRTMGFEPTSAGPGHINDQMITLAYQTPRPFTPFTGQEAAAAAWLGVYLKLCAHAAGCDVRQAYWADYNAVNWGVLAGKLDRVKYPQGAPFSREALARANDTLHGEFLDIQTVQSYFDKLASVFYVAQGTTAVNVRKIGNEIYDSVKPPSTERTVFILTLISRFVALGQFFGPPASPVASGLSAAFSLMAYLVQTSGKSTLPDVVQARADQLTELLATDLGQAAASFAVIGRLIASDAGKLSRFQSLYLTPAWKIEPSSQTAVNAITLAARQWFATALVPVAYSYLGTAVNASPNDLRCGFYQQDLYVYTHPWTNEPALAQFRTVVGWDNGHPVTQTVFFSRYPDFDKADNGPPESIAKLLFEAQDSQDPLLNQYAFMSTANFGRLHSVTNNEDCY